MIATLNESTNTRFYIHYEYDKAMRAPVIDMVFLETYYRTINVTSDFKSQPLNEFPDEFHAACKADYFRRLSNQIDVDRMIEGIRGCGHDLKEK